MLLKCACPKCGQSIEYIGEQVGVTGYCDRCGHAFTLRGNPVRVAWHLTFATFVVVGVIAGVLGRAYSKAHKYDQARNNRPTHSMPVTDFDDE